MNFNFATWQDYLDYIRRAYDKKTRAFRIFMRRTARLAAIADPATGGNEMLCHNWGNAESRRIWSDGWKRWHAYSAEHDRRYHAAWQASKRIAA